jgi:hypothetical protein
MKATTLIFTASAALAVVAGCNRPSTETNRQAETWNNKSDVDRQVRVDDGMGRWNGDKADDDKSDTAKDADKQQKQALKDDVKGAGQGDLDDVDIGASLDANGKIEDSEKTFAPGEPIFVAVDADDIKGNADVTAVIKSMDGAVVAKEAGKVITKDGDDARFNFAKADGLAPGNYVVEITLASGASKTQTIEVK